MQALSEAAFDTRDFCCFIVGRMQAQLQLEKPQFQTISSELSVFHQLFEDSFSWPLQWHLVSMANKQEGRKASHRDP